MWDNIFLVLILVWGATSSNNYYSNPTFDSNLQNVTVQLGSHAFLPCRVRGLGNKSVSWLRTRDSHILTVDRYTFIADERFSLIHPRADSFTLQIKYVQSRDEGNYECQVTTEPKMSFVTQLNVVVPEVRIIGGEGDIFVKSGSGVVIKCVVFGGIDGVEYVFWYHEGARVVGGGFIDVNLERLTPDTTLATLLIKSAEKKDGGNYTCSPYNLNSASVVLHVLSGDPPKAAMQQNSQLSSKSTRIVLNLFLLCLNKLIPSPV